MSDFGSPVAQNVDVSPQKGIQTLSGILGLKQQQQALAGQAAQVQQEQQTASQRAGIAAFMQNFDPTKHVGADGTLDLDNVLTDPKLRQAAGDKFPELIQQMVGIKSAQLQAKQQLVNLNDSTRTQFQSLIGGLRTDPDVVNDTPAGRAKVNQAMGQFAATGPDAARIAAIYGPVTEHTPPGKLAQAVSTIQLQAMDAATQAGKQAPQYLNTGDKFQNVNPQAAGGNLGGSAPIAAGIAPGTNTFTDQANNTWAYNPQNPGHAILVGHGGGTGPSTGKQPPGAPPAPSSVPTAPPVLKLGESQNAVQSGLDDQSVYGQIRAAANKAPVTKNILASIQTLADESKTGPGSRDLAAAETVISQVLPGFKAAGDAATNRQLLGKYVEQLALQTAEANGASTDSARATVAAAIPDPEHMTPEAIKKAARFIQSQTQIAQARGAVAEKYKNEHGGSTQGLQAVDSQFMQNLDPRAFDYIHLPKAQRAQWMQDTFKGDTAAQKAFADKLSVIDHYGGFNYAK